MKQPVNELIQLEVQGDFQHVLVRGADRSNPLLLLIQAGPGFPMIQEAEAFEASLGLESEFSVAYWDPRGCGKSWRGSIPPESMNIGQLTRDTTELTEILAARFNSGRIYVCGFSIGGTLSILASMKAPQLYRAAIAVGPDIDGPESERHAYGFALAEARKRGSAKAIQELEEIGPPPHPTRKQFFTRARWVAEFGGIQGGETYGSLTRKTLSALWRSPRYSALDIYRTLRGIGFCQKHLAEELSKVRLIDSVRSLEVPFYLFQGMKDKGASPRAAEVFFDALQANDNKKSLIQFEHSAHLPHWEEPVRFRKELMATKEQGRLGVLALGLL